MSEHGEPKAVEAPKRRATFDDLVAANVLGETAEVETAGGVVVVRGLSRYEIHLGGKGTDDAAVIEARNLSYAVLDPPMTFGQAMMWIKGSKAGGDVARVSRAIRDLSGLGPGADKS